MLAQIVLIFCVTGKERSYSLQETNCRARKGTEKYHHGKKPAFKKKKATGYVRHFRSFSIDNYKKLFM
jgi:hypothetical protein